MESSDKSQEHCLYKEWMSLQEQELSELQQFHSLNLSTTTTTTDAEIFALLDKITRHFHDYVDQRRHLAHRDVSAFFSPTWCTTMENSMLWIGGCRPSSFFSLMFALCGSDIESKLLQFLQDGSGEFPHLSTSQLSSIDSLQRKAILEEDKLSSKMASLQQEMSDKPLALIAQKCPMHRLNGEARDNIGKIEQEMVSVMEDAEQLRLNTFKEFITLLRPVQALEYVTAAKKLRLCIQSWGVERDHEHGRD